MAPAHPIPALQGPFEESILESDSQTSQQYTVHIDAQSRRRDLLEGATYGRLCGRKWLQKPRERYYNIGDYLCWESISTNTCNIYI